MEFKGQEKIWDWFQTQGSSVFAGAAPRLDYLIKQARALAQNNTPTILNIGVGDAYLERRLGAMGWKTHSLDPSQTTISKLRALGLDGKTGYIENIPYDDHSFDFVFSSEIFEHLSPDQVKSGLSEIDRVLKTRAHLLGTVPFNEELDAGRTLCPQCGTLFHRWGHLQSFNADTLRRCLQRPGSRIICLEVRAFPNFSRTGLRNKAKSIVRWILGRAGSPISQPNLFFIVQRIATDA